MNISITIGVTPELEKALAGLASLINLAGSNIGPSVQPIQQAPTQPDPVQQFPMQQPMQQPNLSAVPTAPPVQPVPEQQPTVQQPQSVPTSAPTYTMDQLAVAATQLVDAGRRDELVQLLASFGTQALTALPKEQYGAFATKLREMGAKI